eukprot:GHVR01046142.1.p1 GENE.GHVR01046142.1~~GHVR01046142.1.p1  ORF type:complete len:437 (-),score=67.14 GHVR01046142.1:87-1397(-)
MENSESIPLFISSLNEYLQVVKLQVEKSDYQDGDKRLNGYINVMMLLAKRASHNTYTLEESTRNLGESLERKRALEEKMKDSDSTIRMCKEKLRIAEEESARILADALQKEEKVKFSEQKLRETERRLNEILKINEEEGNKVNLEDKQKESENEESAIIALPPANTPETSYAIPQGYEMHTIIGDGNCIFRTFAHQLESNQDNYKEYREWCVDHMRQNAQRFQQFITNDKTLDQYLEEMSRDRVWGDHTEIQALAAYLEVNIIIYQEKCKSTLIQNFPSNYPCMQFAYIGHCHYNSITPKTTHTSQFNYLLSLEEIQLLPKITIYTNNQAEQHHTPTDKSTRSNPHGAIHHLHQQIKNKQNQTQITDQPSRTQIQTEIDIANNKLTELITKHHEKDNKVKELEGRLIESENKFNYYHESQYIQTTKQSNITRQRTN